MTKLITMKFTVTIKDEDAPRVVSDDEVKRELIEAYNDWIRGDDCSDVEIIIEEARGMTREDAIQRLRVMQLATEDPVGKVAIMMAIQELKQPEIIRCKDCKCCEEVGPGLFFCDSEDIVPVGQYVEPDGFCSMARRRGE